MSNEKKIEKIEEYAAKGKVDKIVKFMSSKDTELRVAAAKGLGQITDDEGYNALILLIRDPEITVRRAAVNALGVMGRKSGADHVRHVMNHETDPELIKDCQDALAKILNSSAM